MEPGRLTERDSKFSGWRIVRVFLVLAGLGMAALSVAGWFILPPYMAARHLEAKGAFVRRVRIEGWMRNDIPAELLKLFQSPVEVTLYDSVLEEGVFRNLAKMTRLQELAFCGSTFHDKDLLWLTQLQDLKRLDVSRTNLTDRSVDIISRFRSLEGLYIDGARLSPAAIATLKKELPSCEIYD